MLGSVDSGTVLAVVVPTATFVVGGLITLVWRVSALSTKVDGLTAQLSTNTQRLDVIDAKANGAMETARAAVTTAQAVARSTT